MELTPEIVRIVAHICADGYLYSSVCRRCDSDLKSHPRKNPYRKVEGIRYVNNELVMVNQFISDVKRAFGRKTVKVRNEYAVQASWIYDLVKRLGGGKSHEWDIAEEILSASNEIKVEWLRAFFDDEAYVEISHSRIVLNCVNERGLRKIGKMLLGLGISSRFYGPYYKGEFYIFRLVVSSADIERFSQIIGFTHPKKQESLSRILRNKGGAREIRTLVRR